ncbi:RNA polymerase sigma factor [Planctomycetes bacterium TBK1r]|uniref:ECF RNA polymerase sigma factor SigE n=1 Tax=Stieleria magnilauensis TaxID=2527963 RepID=A0ABX5XQ24_9BACT|nr:ECF RNA polymerase sigma factor SigE [Planctomycetes bacterium TBK1r]
MSIEKERIRTALLIVRFQSGDDSAFDDLYSQRRDCVRGMVWRWTGGVPGVVDDVCQQVWLSVLRSLPAMKQPMAFDAWIGRIIRAELALILRRRRRAAVPLDSIAEPEDVLRPGEQPPSWEVLQDALEQIDHASAELLQMRFWQGRSYDQIATTLGIPIGTVRSRLHYAKKTLRSHLTRGNDDV